MKPKRKREDMDDYEKKVARAIRLLRAIPDARDFAARY